MRIEEALDYNFDDDDDNSWKDPMSIANSWDDDTPYWVIAQECRYTGGDYPVCSGLFNDAVSEKKYNLAYNLFLVGCSEIVYTCGDDAILELHRVYNLCPIMYNFGQYIYHPDILLELAGRYALTDILICEFWSELGQLSHFSQIMDMYKYPIFRFSDGVAPNVTLRHIRECLEKGVYPRVTNTQWLQDHFTIPCTDIDWFHAMLTRTNVPELLPQDIMTLYPTSHRGTAQDMIDTAEKYSIASQVVMCYRYAPSYHDTALWEINNPLGIDDVIKLCRDKIIEIRIRPANYPGILEDIERFLIEGFRVVPDMRGVISHHEITDLYDQYGRCYEERYVKSAMDRLAGPSR